MFGDTVLEMTDAISVIILEKGNLRDYRDQTIYAVFANERVS